MDSLLLFIVVLVAVAIVSEAIDVTVTTDSPVILGSKLNIQVKIEDPVFPYYYFYEFKDNVKPLETYNSFYEDSQISMTIDYNDNRIVPGEYLLNLRISNVFGHTFGWLIYETNILFVITDHVPGKIEIMQVNNDSNFVATNQNMTALAQIHDPNYFLSQYSLSYSWLLDNKDVPSLKTDKALSYNFSQPINQNLSVIVEAKNGSNTYYGYYSRLVMPRDPVKIADIKGKLFIEYGELLQVTIYFIGSKPFSYCWTFHKTCEPKMRTTDDSVQITHYMRFVGEYTLLFVAANQVSREEKHYTVKVSDIIKQHTLTFLIIPTVFSLLGILIILVVVVFVLRYRRNYIIEVADFDFILHDDDLIRQTIFERVAQEFCTSRTNCNLNPVEVAE